MSDYIEAAIKRMAEKALRESEANRQFLESLPATSRCARHAGQVRNRDDAASVQQHVAVFADCPLCAKEKRNRADVERLQQMGVPLNLCNATFDNWTAADERSEATKERVREFTRRRRGFLLLIGDYGTGKSHLAVAALRTWRTGLWVKQSELLRRLRETYRDKAAVDPVDQAQRAGCLVLDELGFSAGGRDELPLLHDVLDHRHGNLMPTILTGNVPLDVLRASIGDRMADRLKESSFDIISFAGQSNRAEARERYFKE
jgi:DNA replication protein DnaC